MTKQDIIRLSQVTAFEGVSPLMLFAMQYGLDLTVEEAVDIINEVKND